MYESMYSTVRDEVTMADVEGVPGGEAAVAAGRQKTGQTTQWASREHCSGPCVCTCICVHVHSRVRTSMYIWTHVWMCADITVHVHGCMVASTWTALTMPWAALPFSDSTG